jgi:hypothetical protein
VSVFVGGLVGRLPDVDEADGRVEAVEHGERQRHVAQHGPEHAAVEVEAVVARVLRLDLERLDDPHGHVANHQKRDQLATRLLEAQAARVAAPTQPVDDERRLQQHLHHLKHHTQNVQLYPKIFKKTFEK